MKNVISRHIESPFLSHRGLGWCFRVGVLWRTRFWGLNPAGGEHVKMHTPSLLDTIVIPTPMVRVKTTDHPGRNHTHSSQRHIVGHTCECYIGRTCCQVDSPS